MSLNMMSRFLDAHQIEYDNNQVVSGPSAARTSLVADYPGRILAEALMLKIDGAMAMALVPVNHRPQLEVLKELIDAERVEPAEAQEVCEHFPDCDADAIPPFGMLHGMRVFASETLSRSPRLAFYAGTRARLIEMAYSDYARLVRPIVAPISMAPAPQTRARPGHDERRPAASREEQEMRSVMPAAVG